MRPIDADALIAQVSRKKSGVADKRHTEGFNDAIMRFRSMIHSSLTIDAVPVVRCECCVLHGHCTVEDMFILAGFNDGYCRAGKRLSNAVSGTRMDGEENAAD